MCVCVYQGCNIYGSIVGAYHRSVHVYSVCVSNCVMTLLLHYGLMLPSKASSCYWVFTFVRYELDSFFTL